MGGECLNESCNANDSGLRSLLYWYLRLYLTSPKKYALNPTIICVILVDCVILYGNEILCLCLLISNLLVYHPQKFPLPVTWLKPFAASSWCNRLSASFPAMIPDCRLTSEVEEGLASGFHLV